MLYGHACDHMIRFEYFAYTWSVSSALTRATRRASQTRVARLARAAGFVCGQSILVLCGPETASGDLSLRV